MAARYTYIWEFHVAGEALEEFERHYGPAGTWVELFLQSPAYIATLLLQDSTNSLRYLTIDRWESEAAYQDFLSRFSEQYAHLDARCEHLTTSERLLGHYDEAIV